MRLEYKETSSYFNSRTMRSFYQSKMTLKYMHSDYLGVNHVTTNALEITIENT